MANVVRITSLLLWLPHCLGILYNSLDNTFSQQLKHLLFAACVIPATFYAARNCKSEVLMLLMFMIGLVSELLYIGATTSETYFIPRNGWIVISGFHGLISGILCKSKDTLDGRYFEFHTLAERVYLVTPFTVGIWSAYILMKGVSGFVQVFSSVFFCLTLVGYGVIAYRALRWSGVFDMDLIQIVNHIFTTSFGVVFAAFAVTFLVVSYLAVPFAQSLLALNGVLSSLGVLMELVVYDNA